MTCDDCGAVDLRPRRVNLYATADQDAVVKLVMVGGWPSPPTVRIVRPRSSPTAGEQTIATATIGTVDATTRTATFTAAAITALLDGAAWWHVVVDGRVIVDGMICVAARGRAGTCDSPDVGPITVVSGETTIEVSAVGSAGGGVTVHADLSGRDAAGAHPSTAIVWSSAGDYGEPPTATVDRGLDLTIEAITAIATALGAHASETFAVHGFADTADVVSVTGQTSGQVPTWSGTTWVPTTPASSGAVPVAPWLPPTRQRQPVVNLNATATLQPGAIRLCPIVLSFPTLLSHVEVRQNTNGAAGDVVRLGLYTSDALGRPSDLLVDAGLASAQTQGAKALGVPGVMAPAGILWGTAVLQGPASTAGFISGNNNSGGANWGGFMPVMSANWEVQGCLVAQETAPSGPLPTSLTFANSAACSDWQNWAAVAVRAA